MHYDTEQGRQIARSPWLSDTALLLYLALLKVLVNGLFIARYGIQRDELYFIACGQHLAFGYVDHSPMVPWIARLSQELFGDSLIGLRSIPLLAGGLNVFLAGILARELGGKRFAQCLAVLAVIIAPAFLRTSSILHIPTFEPIYWSLAILVLIRILKNDNPKLWLLFGLIAGLGLLNKPTVLFLGFGVAVGIVLTRHRKQLLSPWIWAGAATALLVYLPNLVWQANHDWATFRFVRTLNKETMAEIPRLLFILGQVLYFHPVNVAIWVAGICFFLFSAMGKPYRAIGWAYVSIAAVMLITHAKVYYLAPIYPTLFAGGAVLIGTKCDTGFAAYVKPALVILMIVGGLLLLPVGIPMLPIETEPKYISAATGGLLDENTAYEITGDWRDQFGWKNQVATTAGVFNTLSAEEKSKCVIIVGNYGQASAVNYYGGKWGLPKALCLHMSYYYWGPGDKPGEVAISYGISHDDLKRFYDEVQQAAVIVSEHVGRWENNLPVFICRKPKGTLQDAWLNLTPAGFS